MAAAVSSIERFSTRDQVARLERLERDYELKRQTILNGASNAGLISYATSYQELTHEEANALIGYILDLVATAIAIADTLDQAERGGLG